MEREFKQFEILKFYIGGEHQEAVVESMDFEYELVKHIHVFHVTVEKITDEGHPVHWQRLSERVLDYLRTRFPDFDFGLMSCSDIAMVIAEFLDDIPFIGPIKRVTVTADNESGGYACE